MRVTDDLDTLLSGPRVLVIDLERLIGIVKMKKWEPRDFKYTNYVHPSKWQRQPSTLTASWSWLGERGVTFAAGWEGEGEHNHVFEDGPNCQACLEHISRVTWDLYNAADIVVTFNGKKSDGQWASGDWQRVGLPACRPWKDVDLYPVARRTFNYPSASLDWLCRELGVPGKRGHYDADGAERAYMGDEKERKRLAKYNGGDIVATIACLRKLQGRVRFPGINFALYFGDEKLRCAHCGHAKLDADTRWAATGQTLYGEYVCRKCTGYTRNDNRKHSTSVRTVL